MATDVRERIDVTDVTIDTINDEEIAFPPDYHLILWNDDTTPFNIVVDALVKIGVSRSKSIEYMMLAHNTGRSVIGKYPYDVAVSMKDEAVNYVRSYNCNDFRMSVEEV